MFESLKKKLSGLVEKITKKVDEKAEREFAQAAPQSTGLKDGGLAQLELPPPAPPIPPAELKKAAGPEGGSLLPPAFPPLSPPPGMPLPLKRPDHSAFMAPAKPRSLEFPGVVPPAKPPFLAQSPKEFAMPPSGSQSPLQPPAPPKLIRPALPEKALAAPATGCPLSQAGGVEAARLPSETFVKKQVSAGPGAAGAPAADAVTGPELSQLAKPEPFVPQAGKHGASLLSSGANPDALQLAWPEKKGLLEKPEPPKPYLSGTPAAVNAGPRGEGYGTKLQVPPHQRPNVSETSAAVPVPHSPVGSGKPFASEPAKPDVSERPAGPKKSGESGMLNSIADKTRSLTERFAALKKRSEEPPVPAVATDAGESVELLSKPKPGPEAEAQHAQKAKSFKERIFGAILETEISESDLEEIFSGLEVDLLENDVALEVTERMIADMRAGLRGKKVRRGEVETAIREAIRLSLEGVLSKGKAIDLLEEIKKAEKPYKVVFVGINGTGKTTTIAKIANLCLHNGFEPVIAASDTFRAASIEQLEAHAQKLGVKLVKHKYGADAAAVAYDAIEHARAKGKPVVLVDTAGRMQTNANLMDELRKIIRVVEPNLVVFVGDSLTGNDAVEQARTFNGVRVDAVILTKSDADAKGGACLSISYAIGKPVLYLGTGQNYSDLVKFTPEWFMEKVGAA